MDTKTVIKQVAVSLFARRKKWIVLTTFAGLVFLVPAAYLLSKEPPRYRTTATILIDAKVERAPVFQELSPNRPLPVQLAILQSRLLAASVVEALPKSAVDDLVHNPYGRDYLGEFMDWVSRLRGKETPIMSPQRRAVAELRHLPFEDLGFAKIDHHRALRQGFPEVIMGQGKETREIAAIVRAMRRRKVNVLVTRVSAEKMTQLKRQKVGLTYHARARAATWTASRLK